MKTREHVELIRKEEERKCGTWFKPTISDTTNIILSNTRQDILNESINQRINRLAYEDAENIDQNKHKKEQEIYGNMTFTPSIAPISRELGTKSSLQELHVNRRGQRVKAKIKDQLEAKESNECSFQPSITKSQESYKKYLKSVGKYHSHPEFDPPVAWRDYSCPLMNNHEVTEGYGQDNKSSQEIWRPPGSINMLEPEKMAKDIRLSLLEKEKKRQNELIVKEIEELQECTFQPKVNTTIPIHNNKPIVVRGLGRHLELRNLLNKQKQLEKERKENAFRVKNIDKYRNTYDGTTIIQVGVMKTNFYYLFSWLIITTFLLIAISIT